MIGPRAACASVLALAIALPAAVGAIPRFAVRSGAACSLCHTNPSGAGLRTAYGRAVFERQFLPSPWISELAGEGAGLHVDPRIGDAVALGADLRGGYLRAMPRKGAPGLDSFFLMEANLHVGAELGRHVTLSYTHGAYGSFEAFGLLHFGLRESPADDAWSGYLKLGRFVPAYGVRLENHSTFTREGIGFSATMRDTGLEAGLAFRGLGLQASHLRGALTDKDPEGTTYLRLEWAGGGALVRHLAGASLSYGPRQPAANPAITVMLDPAGGFEETRLGVHLGVAIGRLSYLGEIDRVAVRANPGGMPAGGMPAGGGATGRAGTQVRALLSYQELSFVPVQGIDVQLLHEYWDPDTALAGGRLQRWGGSVEVYPWEYVELKALYRRTYAPASHPLDGTQEVVALLHLFF